MRIEKTTINGREFRLFYVTIEDREICVAEERLNTFIEECIFCDKYHFVENIDNMYEYYIPQDIADGENEQEILISIKSIDEF